MSPPPLLAQVLAQTHARLRRRAVFAVERDRLEARPSIDRECGGLPDTGLEDEPPDAERPGLGFERGDEPPPEPAATRGRRHVHALQLRGPGIEHAERA